MALDAVHKYMKTQNRPYSVNDIMSNLHNEFGKSAVQKALDQLVSESKIFEKVYGKQKIYCIVQESKYEHDELMRIDRELQAHANEIQNKLQEVEKEYRSKEAEVMALKSSCTLKELNEQKAELNEDIIKMTKKVDELMENSGSVDLASMKRKAEESLKEYSKEYTKRRRICLEMIDCILENFPGNKKDLYEEIGIEDRVVK
ncbi:homologous-pairing protein 2 homolog [Orussus abietinus]|uniref:homologous-pairing protein 2 homolog n=1 Tax=Orussus abietinus TaxID=222816 RepID=UPI000626AE00|nr:homologous-pairing protein 2 homolog [Orussus abietinus]XP_012283841.1 homologous-pairing protein 2 homolog [Orussus abietinus]XP_012283842.1 homologous-pairing protein 2 homolog [Orussus abietinus]